MTTVLVSRESFAADRTTVEGDAFRHLVKAKRSRVGERVRVVDGRGAARWALIESLTRRSAELTLGEAAPSGEPRASVEVWAAPPRAGRASWMVEKLTEIGVRAVRFVRTERASRSYGEATLERLRRVAAAAVEQSGRSRLPEVSGVHPWEEALERFAEAERRWLLCPGAEVGAAVSGATRTAILVGPEGGWSDAELAAAEALPAVRIGLGPTILRVETAAVVAAARCLPG